MIAPVGAAAVRPTWPCPKANYALAARAERPITGSESGSDGRWPIQPRDRARLQAGQQPPRMLRAAHRRARNSAARRGRPARRCRRSAGRPPSASRNTCLRRKRSACAARRSVTRASRGSRARFPAERRRPSCDDSAFECAPAAMTTRVGVDDAVVGDDARDAPVDDVEAGRGRPHERRTAAAQTRASARDSRKRIRDNGPARAARTRCVSRGDSAASNSRIAGPVSTSMRTPCAAPDLAARAHRPANAAALS